MTTPQPDDAALPLPAAPSSLDRRAFTRRMALGLALPLVAASCSQAEDPPSPANAPSKRDPMSPLEPAAPDAPAEDPKAIPMTPIDLYLELVRHSDPDRLEPEHLAALRIELSRQLFRSRMLARFPLTNADEPMPVFRAYRGDGGLDKTPRAEKGAKPG